MRIFRHYLKSFQTRKPCDTIPNLLMRTVQRIELNGMPIEAESLEHFPNVYMEVAEFDCLRDEGIAFAERLRAEGVLQSFMK